MTAVPSKKWIILLNKSPRGPFSEDEIKELMAQGLLRHNDLGFRLPQEGEPNGSSWKFLWQFAEFDSRLKEKDTPPPPAVLEKRKAKTEGEIQKKVEEHVPLDLKSIRVEDLILKSQPAPRREFHSPKLKEERELSSQRNVSHEPSSGGTQPLFALMGLVAIGVCGFLFFREFQSPSSGKTTERKLSSSEAPAQPKPIEGVKKGLPTVRGPEAPMKPPKPPKPPQPGWMPPPGPSSKPAARDRGEIREEELLRIREEERRRELEEQLRQKRLEEERNREESRDEDADEDEEKTKPGRPKPKSKRAVDAQEEHEDDDDPREAPPRERLMEDEEPPPNWVD